MSDDLRYCVTLQDGTTTRTCWVDKRVAAGNRITLKNSEEPERWWTVTWVSAQARTRHELGNQSGWHVGGL